MLAPSSAARYDGAKSSNFWTPTSTTNLPCYCSSNHLMLCAAFHVNRGFASLFARSDQKISQEEFASGAQPQPQHDDL
eukprot:SAG31_NODE_1744_length_7379_cov_28.134753_2_plen_78_part_00